MSGGMEDCYKKEQEKQRYNEFESYLQDKHAAQYAGLDDDMGDDFEYWIQELDVDDWIRLGSKFSLRKNIHNGEK